MKVHVCRGMVASVAEAVDLNESLEENASKSKPESAGSLQHWTPCSGHRTSRKPRSLNVPSLGLSDVVKNHKIYKIQNKMSLLYWGVHLGCLTFSL